MRLILRIMALVLVFGTLAGCSDNLTAPVDQDRSPSFRDVTVKSVPFEAVADEDSPESIRAFRAGKTSTVVTDCVFITKSEDSDDDDESAHKSSDEDMEWTLVADCTTDGTILIPDGMTLNGDSHTITAVDPVGGHFTGAVVQNGGAMASVKDLIVTTDGLANVCDGGANRLRGIMFEGASGKIEHNTVTGVNQGASSCQEGNAIEVRNSPFDGTHPGTVKVKIEDNTVLDYQKTGIVANGDVDVKIEDNYVGESATQLNLAANSIQIGFGAFGKIEKNEVMGNQWLGASNWGATAILLYLPEDGAKVEENTINGNSDIGLYVYSFNGKFEENRISDNGVDGPHGDYGIVDYGSGNVFEDNDVCGFDDPFWPDPLNGEGNTVCGS